MQRIALMIEYDGSRYSGWQKQRNQTSVQSNVESALSRIAAHPVQITCAGRTDAGVHASAQICHFDTTAERSDLAWSRGTNSHLPKDIRVIHVFPVPMHFHARFSALSRRYSYVILNRAQPPGLWHHGVTWVRDPLDTELMHEAAQHLCGEHDFSAFRAGECQAKSPIRTIHRLDVMRVQDLIIVDIEANAFLHHMVRNIVGTLIPIGKGRYLPIFMQQVLASLDRRAALMTAPANGLYFLKASYPTEFEVNNCENLPWFLMQTVPQS